MSQLLGGKCCTEKPIILPEIALKWPQVYIVWKPITSSKHRYITLYANWWQKCYTRWKHRADLFGCDSCNTSVLSWLYWLMALKGVKMYSNFSLMFIWHIIKRSLWKSYIKVWKNQELFDLCAPVVDVYCVLCFLNGRMAVTAGYKLALW
jgi:hypothetical protein